MRNDSGPGIDCHGRTGQVLFLLYKTLRPPLMDVLLSTSSPTLKCQKAMLRKAGPFGTPVICWQSRGHGINTRLASDWITESPLR